MSHSHGYETFHDDFQMITFEHLCFSVLCYVHVTFDVYVVCCIRLHQCQCCTTVCTYNVTSFLLYFTVKKYKLWEKLVSHS